MSKTRTRIIFHKPRKPSSPIQFLWDWSGEDKFWVAVHVGHRGGDPVLAVTVDFGTKASDRIGKVWDWWHRPLYKDKEN